MARPPYDPVPSVAASTQGISPIHVDTPAAAFGGGIGAAESQLGGDEKQAGATLFQAAVSAQDFKNTNDARQANIGFMNDASDIYTKFGTLQGQAAMDALPKFRQDLDDAIQKHAGTLQSPVAQSNFLDLSRYMSSRMVMGAGQEAGQKQVSGWIRTNEANVDANSQFAIMNQNTPQQVLLGASQAQASAEENALHLGYAPGSNESKELIAKSIGRFYRPLIESQAATNPDLAASTFARGRDKMDADTIAYLDRSLRASGERTQVAAVSAASINNLPFDPQTGAWLDPATHSPITPQGQPGAPVSLDTGTRMRAQVVHDAAVKQGASDDEAWGWASNAVHESGAVPAPQPGDGGISHGMFQLNKDQLAAYQASHNGHLPEQDSIETQLQFARSRITLPADMHGAGAYSAAISLGFEVPKGGVNEAQSRAVTGLQLASMGSAPSPAPGGAAPAPGTPGAPVSATHTPEGYSIEGQQLALAWSNAQKAFPSRPDLQLEAVRPVWEHIQQVNMLQQKYEGEAAKSQRDSQNTVMNNVITTLNTDPTKFSTTMLDVKDAAGNYVLTPEMRENLTEFSKRKFAETGIEDTAPYGKGYAKAYSDILAAPDNPDKINNLSDIVKRGAPGGDLTGIGVEKLSRVFLASRKDPDQAAVNRSEASLLNYAKGKLSFEEDTGPVKIRDPKGEQIFNAEFIPKFEKGLSDWTAAGKDPWQYLSRENVDKVMSGMRNPADMARDRLLATGEEVPGAVEPPNAPIPPAPKDANPSEWSKIMTAPPVASTGHAYTHAAWATVLQRLLENGDKAVPDFDEKFGKFGMSGADYLERMKRPMPAEDQSLKAPFPQLGVGP